MGDGHDVPVVRVQGTGRATARPDRSDLQLQATHLDADPKEALRVAGGRADAVAAVLRNAGVPDTAWHTSGVRVAEEWRWEENKQVSHGHRATARFDVTVTDDLGVVNGLVPRAVAAGAEVLGHDWSVSPENPGRQEAYRRAALDARARATAYAEALGLRLGAVLRIDEIGEQRVFPQPRMMMAMAADAPGGQPPETVHVGEVDVDASVTVTFALDGGAPTR